MDKDRSLIKTATDNHYNDDQSFCPVIVALFDKYFYSVIVAILFTGIIIVAYTLSYNYFQTAKASVADLEFQPTNIFLQENNLCLLIDDNWGFADGEVCRLNVKLPSQKRVEVLAKVMVDEEQEVCLTDFSLGEYMPEKPVPYKEEHILLFAQLSKYSLAQ